jgi:PleD family two-component response regulator
LRREGSEIVGWVQQFHLSGPKAFPVGFEMADQLGSDRPMVALIANDQEWSARSLDSILSPQGYTVIRAYTGLQALERARTARPDLVILDAQLPDIHGLEVCRQLRMDPRFGRLTPIVITTAGPSGRTQRLEAYKAGAWEFCGQPLDGEALLARFKTFIEAKQEADALRDATLLESGTGLYTVKGLARRVEEIGADMMRHGRPFACVALALAPSDADPAGLDQPRLGELLRDHRRASDAVAHLGGEEYVLVAPDTAREGAMRLVDRLEGILRTEGSDIRLAAGYSAVENLRTASVEPAAMLDHATAALRYGLGHPNGGTVVSFEDIPTPIAT